MNKKDQLQIKFITGLVILLSLVFACQRQLYFDETPADGVLKKDGSGNCAPVVTSGIFNIDTNFTGNNFIEVEVEVSKKGSYSLTTDTVNGYWFKAKGKFDNAGSFRVRLLAEGKPQLAGQNIFTIKFNASTCKASITVLDAAPAEYNVVGAPGECANVVVEGNYNKGIALDNSNKVKLTLNVIRPGYYSISMTTANGYTLSGAGILSNTGQQTIVLFGSGTPFHEGTDFFTAAGASGSCTFSITVGNRGPVGANHFPLTRFSYWTYDDVSTPGDSINRKVTSSTINNGNPYEIMEEKNRFGTIQYNFRRDGNNYFEYGSVDKYTSSVKFSPEIREDIPFLKENLATADTWSSPTYTGTATFGQTILIRYNYLCTNHNAVTIINGTTYDSVYKIEMRPEIASVGNPWGPTGEVYEFFYAEGTGLIYFRRVLNGVTQVQWNVKSWFVY